MATETSSMVDNTLVKEKNIKIHLIRHAESLRQELGEGRWHTGLSNRGQAQANYLAKWLLSTNLYNTKVFLSSPLKRARETADIIAETTGNSYIRSRHLKEANFKISDDLPVKQSPFFENQKTVCDSDRYRSMKFQVNEALQQMVKKAFKYNSSVLAVSHGGFMKTVLRVITDNDCFSATIRNTGIMSIEWKNGRWYLLELNRLDHLPDKLRS